MVGLARLSGDRDVGLGMGLGLAGAGWRRSLMYWLLVHVSGIPPLEAHMLRSRGERFGDYQRRACSAFFPLPPKAPRMSLVHPPSAPPSGCRCLMR